MGHASIVVGGTGCNNDEGDGLLVSAEDVDVDVSLKALTGTVDGRHA